MSIATRKAATPLLPEGKRYTPQATYPDCLLVRSALLTFPHLHMSSRVAQISPFTEVNEERQRVIKELELSLCRTLSRSDDNVEGLRDTLARLIQTSAAEFSSRMQDLELRLAERNALDLVFLDAEGEVVQSSAERKEADSAISRRGQSDPIQTSSQERARTPT